MKKVYQTIVDQGNGNCLQATTASILDLELKDVPHFLEFGDKWFIEYWNFFKGHGYDVTEFGAMRTKKPTIKEVMKHDGGINGFFVATVYSQTFNDGTTHSVIVDLDLNIVHDPNPNQLALKLEPKDVLSVVMLSSGWHINTDGNIIEEKDEIIKD